MNPTEIWKNFNLGFELDVAGTFLFNGIRTFHEMDVFDYRSDIFDFLYNIAVGVERVQKIALVLTEHDDDSDQAEFEKSLITHSHQELDRRLREHGHPTLAPIHNSFLSMLNTFYKTYRYDRYGMRSLYRDGDERKLLTDWINDHFSANIEFDGVFPVSNSNELRRSIGKVIGKIIKPLYERIRGEAHKLNLYTYEIRYDSKAFWILIANQYDLLNADRIRMEVLLYLAASQCEGPNLKLMRSTKPLSLDFHEEASYVRAVLKPQAALDLEEEIEAQYEDLNINAKDRFLLLDAIRSSLYLSDEREDLDDEC